MRLKQKNGCAGTGETLQGTVPGNQMSQVHDIGLVENSVLIISYRVHESSVRLSSAYLSGLQFTVMKRHITGQTTRKGGAMCF